MRTLVVLPTYNEAGNIVRMLGRVREALPDCGVLVVDDNSPDGTAELVESAAPEVGGEVSVLRRSQKSGLGSAYRAGFRWGLEHGYEAMVEMDSDFQHDPAALPSLVEPLTRGYEVSIGSRYIEGGSIPNWSWFRHLLSWSGNKYADVLLSLGVADSTAGFRAYAASVLQRLDLDRIGAEGYGFQIEMTYRAKQAGATITEVPIAFLEREAGESKMSYRIVVEALGLVTVWWFERLGEALRHKPAPRPSPVAGGTRTPTEGSRPSRPA